MVGSTTESAPKPLLAIENLVVECPGHPPKRAFDGVTFNVESGQSVGIVGGSGCGKTTIAKTLVGLEKPASGKILFEGNDLFKLGGRREHETRRAIQMVFQDTLGALNPRMRVGDALLEVL